MQDTPELLASSKRSRKHTCGLGWHFVVLFLMCRLPSRFRIYMYDLPWHVAFPYEYNDASVTRDPMYSAVSWLAVGWFGGWAVLGDSWEACLGGSIVDAARGDRSV